MYKILGIVCAALSITALFGGYFFLRHRQAPPAAVVRPDPPAQAPELRVFENEAYLKNGRAVVSGTVENVSDKSLSRVALTIKLIGRDGRREELKVVPLDPPDLAPGASADYVLTLPSGEWGGARVARAAGADTDRDYVFASLRGKARPRETPPAPTVRTVIAKRPAPRKNGEEFLNTPDDPLVIK